MAGYSPKDYLLTIDDFVAHWTLVNAALGTAPLVLSGGYAIANLQSDRATLALQFATVESSGNTEEGASADRTNKRNIVKERIRQFNQTVRGLLPGSIYANMTPTNLNPHSGGGAWKKATDDVANAWSRINTDTPPPAGFTPPLLLTGGYTRANFGTDAAALEAAFTAVRNASVNAKAARGLRDALYKPIRARLVQYRLAVEGKFPAGNALITSLPRVAPAPGVTPKAVTDILWRYNVTEKAGTFTFKPSASPKVTTTELRYSPDAKYNPDNEVTVKTVSGTDTTIKFSPTQDLPLATSPSKFKIYTANASGNERGSRVIVAAW